MKKTPEHKAVTWREGRRIEELVRTSQRREGAAVAVDGKYVSIILTLGFSLIKIFTRISSNVCPP